MLEPTEQKPFTDFFHIFVMDLYGSPAVVAVAFFCHE